MLCHGILLQADCTLDLLYLGILSDRQITVSRVRIPLGYCQILHHYLLDASLHQRWDGNTRLGEFVVDIDTHIFDIKDRHGGVT